jgi:prepilin-type processing-associated H-X9-DG protein
MWRSSGLRAGTAPRFLRSGLLGLLVAAVAVSYPLDAGLTAAQPPAAPPTGLDFVPHDAAFFVYADVAGIWGHELTKTFRAAEMSTFADLEETAAKAFGARVQDLKSAVLFFPKIKRGDGADQFGVALTFATGYDKKKLEAGFAGLAPKNAKLKVVAASDTVAVVLVGLGDEYGKPQPADADGHLTAALKAAASGRHTVVAGATLASLPDELQKDDLPGEVRALQPVLRSQAVVATLDLGKELTLNVRVRTKRETQAADAEKALAALVGLLADEAKRELPDLEKDAEKDAGLADLVAVLQAGLKALRGAKFELDGTEARATLTLPLAGLPLTSAFTASVMRAQQAAANQRSANNLKQIALALHTYHDTLGSFPPAAVCGKRGKPELSWRVLILPYIEQGALYKQFKLDEPWDSDTNKKLLAKMPSTYALPGKTKPGGTDTYYRVFVGNGAGWDWVTGTKIFQIADGTSNTLAVVTAAESVPWTKPDELAFDPEKDMTKLIGMVVNGKAQVAMFDGSVRTLKKLPSRTTLNALITKNGGEVIGTDF